ncbi:MAG: hypothetical protein M1492_09625 [Gammaproteobacteria bacterium]|nr:hypothetical protein [Gammaproteobacteria bacterium]
MTISREIRDRLESKAPGRAVLAALERLLTDDAYLLKVDANERSISHRFGMHLQAELPDFHVDCEYNRTGVDPKRINSLYLTVHTDDTNGKTVYPDVIAHIRGQDQNYLVVEFKKSSSSDSTESDFNKLRGYKGDASLKYEYALFIELAVDGQAGVSRVEWVDA